MNGFQVWVNLPRRDKMMKPRYQEIPKSKVPVGRSADGKAEVRVIAGESLGVQAVIETRTPIMYLHFTIRPGGAVDQKVPAAFNALAYAFRGQGAVNGKALGEGQMAMFGPGTLVQVGVPAAAKEPLELLLLAGQPLNEPVARYGPFVMNTKEEISQAFDDYKAGRLGAIAPA